MRTEDPTDPNLPRLAELGPQTLEAPRARRRGLAGWLAIVAVVVVVLLVAASFVHLPYYIESPGSAPSVNPLIVVDASHRHPVSGDVLLTTVSLRDRVSPLDVVAAWFDPNANLIRHQDLNQGVSDAQYAQLAAQQMDASKQAAIVVGLRRLGYTVVEHGDGVLVTNVEPGSGAASQLHDGDVIVGADGRSVAIASDLTTAIRAHRPGDTMSLVIAAASGRRTSIVRLTSCPASVPGCAGTNGQRPFLGIELVTKNERFDYPFKVDIDLSGVGGPSAGLAFTLGVINELTTGHLTGGHRVAVTGTIDLDGNVGPIGGIALKTVAAERAGADVFLVPKDDNTPGGEPQYKEAVAKARGHHLLVIPVGTLEDALNALRSIGGDLSGIGQAPAAAAA